MFCLRTLHVYVAKTFAYIFYIVSFWLAESHFHYTAVFIIFISVVNIPCRLSYCLGGPFSLDFTYCKQNQTVHDIGRCIIIDSQVEAN